MLMLLVIVCGAAILETLACLWDLIREESDGSDWSEDEQAYAANS